MTHPQPSLRERHRARTLTEIHQAALEPAAGGSFSDTTVDAIAENAGISRRTFFNYYASKEDAVLGITPPQISEYAHARYMDRSTGDEFARTVRLYCSWTSCGSPPGRPSSCPAAESSWSSTPSSSGASASTSTPPRTSWSPRWPNRPGRAPCPAPEETTHAYVLLAGSVIKFAFRTDTHLATVSDDDAAVQHALDHAIGVFRTAFKEIA